MLAGLICLALSIVALSTVGGPAAQAATNPTRIMLLGDSLTHGSSGDYTWRYRLWKNFSAGSVDFVGPRSDLNNLYTQDGDDTSDHTYVDPKFDQDHAARSGRTLADGVDLMPTLSKTYQPDVVVILLGINDISLGGTPDQIDQRMRSVISEARAVNPNVNFAIGLLLPQVGLSSDASWESRRKQSNTRITQIATTLSTTKSKIALADASTSLTLPGDLWDGVHLGPKGEVKVAAAFAKALASIGVGSPMATLPVPVMQPLPAAPKLSATTGDGKVVINWNRPANAFNFIIEVDHPGIGWSAFPIAMNATSWTVDSLTNGAEYHFRVTPIGKGGTGPVSNLATATPTGPAPGAAQLTVSTTGSKVVLDWTKVSNATGAYVWTRDTTGDGEWRKSSFVIANGWTPYEMPGMLKGANYQFKVQTANGIIPGAYSNTVSTHTTGPAPAAPTLSSSLVSASETDLSWTKPSNANAYYIQIRDVTDGEAWKKSSLPTWDTSFRAGWMKVGDLYQYRVVAYNDYVEGGISNTVNVQTPNEYDALGDSYSAGTGTKARVDSCYHSTYGYASMLSKDLGGPFHYDSCHGATTSTMLSGQLTHLSKTTKTVTITAGGNDLGFADVIHACVLPFGVSCDDAIAGGYAKMSALALSYDKLFSEIRRLAPYAKVFVGTYPRLFSDATCIGTGNTSAQDHQDLNAATDDADALILRKAQDHGFATVDVRQDFIGHAVCSPQEYINGISSPNDESFHPNRLGNQTYANDFFTKIWNG